MTVNVIIWLAHGHHHASSTVIGDRVKILEHVWPRSSHEYSYRVMGGYMRGVCHRCCDTDQPDDLLSLEDLHFQIVAEV